MISRHLTILSIAVALLIAIPVQAMANLITAASATFSCGPPASFTATFIGIDLDPTHSYQVNFTLTATSPTGTVLSTGPLSQAIPPGRSGDFSVTYVNGTAANIVAGITYTLAGTASLYDITAGATTSTVSVTFPNNPNSQITCGNQGGGLCVQGSKANANFNGTPIYSGSSIWFNANLKSSGIPSTGATVFFTGSTVTINNTTYPVPNAQINFMPSATCASTTFNASTNTWITTVPVSGNTDDIFFDGVALGVGTLANIQNPVVWNGTFSTNTPGVSIQWKWGAAVYKAFTGYDGLSVKPSHSLACGINNGDQAGTPENPVTQKQLIGGARGGGGSNFTGSWSGTFNVTPVCPH